MKLQLLEKAFQKSCKVTKGNNEEGCIYSKDVIFIQMNKKKYKKYYTFQKSDRNS